MPYGGNPHTDAADAVRAMVGDIDPAAAKLDDNTYTFILATETNIYSRAAMASEALAGHYGHEFSKRIGDFWREAQQQFEHYATLAKEFRRQSRVRINAHPYAGGINVAEVELAADDTTRVQPSFHIGMIDDTEPTTVPQE